MSNYKTLLDDLTEANWNSRYPLVAFLIFVPRIIMFLFFKEELPSIELYFIWVAIILIPTGFIENFLKTILNDYSIKSMRLDPIGFGSKNFFIYKNQNGLIEAIKTGWSWPAFGLNSFWLLFKGIYGLSILSIFIFLITSILPIPYYALLLLNGAICYLFGTFGNQLLIHTLKEKGYKFALSVNADNDKGAKAQFVEYMSNKKA